MINQMNSDNCSSVENGGEFDDEDWDKLCGEFDDELDNQRYSVEVFAPAG